MLESFFRAHLLGKRVSRFMCQNVVLLFTRCCHCFNQKSFMDLFHNFRSSGISGYFQVLSFCLSEGFKVSDGCFVIFRCSLTVFLSKELHGYSG